MRHTNNARHLWLMVLIGVASTILVAVGCSAAEEVKFRKRLTADETLCLRELFQDGDFRRWNREISKFIAEAAVARPKLKDNGQRAFVFVVHDTGWCGSAGCVMLIGERLRGGRCHLLGEGKGAIEHLAALDSRHLLDERKGETISVLDRRDHRYHRLEAPCEFYFDGRQYRQVREECPNGDVQR